MADFVVLVGGGSSKLCKQRHGISLLSEPSAPIAEKCLSLQVIWLEDQHFKPSLTTHKIHIDAFSTRLSYALAKLARRILKCYDYYCCCFEKTLSYLARLVQWIDDCRKLCDCQIHLQNRLHMIHLSNSLISLQGS